MTERAPKHIASHPLPVTTGHSGGSLGMTIWCGRCKGSFAPDQDWVDRSLERGLLEPYTIEDLRRLGLVVPEIHRQVVEVTGGYAYRWAGLRPLVVGDRVLLPSNSYRSYSWEADVVRIGSDYTGAMSSIIEITKSAH